MPEALYVLLNKKSVHKNLKFVVLGYFPVILNNLSLYITLYQSNIQSKN